MPHFIRVAKEGSMMIMRVDNIPAATMEARKLNIGGQLFKINDVVS